MGNSWANYRLPPTKFTVKVERRKQKQQEEHNRIKTKCLQYGRLK